MDARGVAQTATTHAIGAAGLQAETLLAFTFIYASLGVCNHKFALCLGAGSTNCAAALAFAALGGACLVLDEDAGLLQAAGRAGATDFTVTGLSEALRILKNEVRKGTPVSVGLLGDIRKTIEEMLHRGVQPEIGCGMTEQTSALEPFVTLGAYLLRLPAELPGGLGRAQLVSSEAESMMERRALDRDLQAKRPERSPDGLSQLEVVQAKWLAVAPRLFRADKTRVYLDLERNG